MSSGSYAQESFGATQWLFDTYWNVPYTFLDAPAITSGGLSGIDVLVTPGAIGRPRSAGSATPARRR